MTSRRTLYPLIALGIVAISFGAILIRLLPDIPVLSIAAWRLGVAVILLAPLGGARLRRTPPRRADLLTGLGSGVFLAFHFILWISSLEYTSVASSVVLVDTSPIFVGLGAWVFLRERPRGWLIAGIVLSVIGGGVIGWGDMRATGEALVGDLLALGGAAMAAGYLILGRRVRPRVDIIPYLTITYGTAAAVLLVGTGITHAPLIGFSGREYLYLVLLAVGPQLLGHGTINWALRHLSAGTVAVLTLGEPIGATALAYLILGEGLTWLKGIGAAAILTGIYLSLRGEEYEG